MEQITQDGFPNEEALSNLAQALEQYDVWPLGIRGERAQCEVAFELRLLREFMNDRNLFRAQTRFPNPLTMSTIDYWTDRIRKFYHKHLARK